jgi:hypothetical protein
MDSKDVWKVVFAIGASLALILHAVFPRYEWRTAGENGAIVVVYDRWANYFQRAVYDEHGKVTPMDPFKPF